MAISAPDLLKLVQTVVDAAKSAEGGDAAEQGRALDGLRALRKQRVSTGVLAETQAGKRIRALSKSPQPEIAKAAVEVVAAWKEVVRQESEGGSGSRQDSGGLGSSSRPASAANLARTASAGGGAGASGGPSSQQATAAGPAPSSSGQPPSTAAAAAGVLPAEAAAAAPRLRRELPPLDVWAVPKAGDAIRDKCRLNLAQSLHMAAVEGTDGDVIGTAVAVETEIFKQNGGVTQAYKAKFRALQFNLKDEKNPDLRRKVLGGEISPDVLVTLPPEELASDAKKEENARIREKKLFDSAPSAAKQATTDQFQCGKCRQRKCTYYQMQTRSADEPMTTFVSCLNCNNRWKFC